MGFILFISWIFTILIASVPGCIAAIFTIIYFLKLNRSPSILPTPLFWAAGGITWVIFTMAATAVTLHKWSQTGKASALFLHMDLFWNPITAVALILLPLPGGILLYFHLKKERREALSSGILLGILLYFTLQFPLALVLSTTLAQMFHITLQY